MARTSRGCFLIWRAGWQESEGQAEAVGSSFAQVAMEKRGWDFSGEKKLNISRLKTLVRKRQERKETWPLADKMEG